MASIHVVEIFHRLNFVDTHLVMVLNVIHDTHLIVSVLSTDEGAGDSLGVESTGSTDSVEIGGVVRGQEPIFLVDLARGIEVDKSTRKMGS